MTDDSQLGRLGWLGKLGWLGQLRNNCKSHNSGLKTQIERHTEKQQSDLLGSLQKPKIEWILNFGHLACQNSLRTQECQTTYLPLHINTTTHLTPLPPYFITNQLSTNCQLIVNLFSYKNQSILFPYKQFRRTTTSMMLYSQFVNISIQ